MASLLAGTLSNKPLADPDIGWHIRTGERILATYSLPRIDTYSSTMHGKPWIAWEWLYDVILGVLHRSCGLNGVVWLCAVLVSTTLATLLWELLRRGTALILSIALMLLAEAAAMIHLFARPHIVSWLFALLWFIALERWESGSQKRVPRWLPWFFPLSMVLWVNLHGEWPIGLVLLAIYGFAAFIGSWRERDSFAAVTMRHRASVMALTWVASALATLSNPFGWRLHAHIYHYLGNRYLMNRIAEFRSPDFHGWAPRCFAAILLLTLLAFARRGGAVPLSHLLVVLLAVYTGLLSSRNLPVSSMLLVLIAGPMLSVDLASLASSPGAWGWMRRQASRIVDFSDRMGTQELELRGHIWPIVCACATLAICMQGGRLGSRQLFHAEFDSKAVPVAAVDFLESHPGAQPIFSTDSWGGYLIYRLYPNRQVVVDDRHDLYGSNRIREVLIMTQGEPGWRDLLGKWQIRTVLLPSGSTLANLLSDLPQDWRLSYEDKVAVVYERR